MELLRRNRIPVVIVSAAAFLALFAAVFLSRAVADDEYAKADERLGAELAGAVQAVEELGRGARARAVRLAARTDVQRALAARDEAALQAVADRESRVAFEADGRLLAGDAPGALAVPASVVADTREIGRVLADIPISAVEARTALAPGDRLLAGDGPDESPGAVTVDGRKYRAVSTVAGPTRLSALAPDEPIADAVADRRRRILLALLASFLTVALLTVLAARAIQPRRRLVVRAHDRPPADLGDRRSREAVELVGDALAAGHDVDALLPVILQSAVTTSGAAGARLVADGKELARAGQTETGERPLSIPIVAGKSGDGQLVLYPARGATLDHQGVELAEWLAGRASIALQNAHLHRVARRLATTDELTQLANRRQFDEALAAEVVRAERFRDPVAVVVADLDNFKTINDRFGHDVGDLVLRAFAAAIRMNVRDVDLPARYGGEEFTVLLPATDAEGGAQLAERLRLACEKLVVDSGGSGPVTVRSSFGVASFPTEPSASALMRAADRALYRAKAAGKNTVFVAERETAGAQ
ncbi:MAG TPA: GGDEF domain-containing protein [Gaiellaceae bacterium]|nr:GGDEF domain-containing protein [Gaiellaceae bacterium]